MQGSMCNHVEAEKQMVDQLVRVLRKVRPVRAVQSLVGERFDDG